MKVSKGFWVSRQGGPEKALPPGTPVCSQLPDCVVPGRRGGQTFLRDLG